MLKTYTAWFSWLYRCSFLHLLGDTFSVVSKSGIMRLIFYERLVVVFLKALVERLTFKPRVFFYPWNINSLLVFTKHLHDKVLRFPGNFPFFGKNNRLRHLKIISQGYQTYKNSRLRSFNFRFVISKLSELVNDHIFIEICISTFQTFSGPFWGGRSGGWKRVRGQGWRSGDSRSPLLNLWPGFISQHRRHMWVEFIVRFSPLLREIFLWELRIFPLLKNQHKFQEW